MLKVALTILTIFVPITATSAEEEHHLILAQEAADYIEKAGFWCGWVSNIRKDNNFDKGRIILHVTCDTRARFAQYRLIMSSDNKYIDKVEEDK